MTTAAGPTPTLTADADAEIDPAPPALSLGILFLKFLGFGLLAFGGPVAQIGMIRRELIDGERWMSSARFNRLLAVMQVLPGPEAHELCVHLGMRARGRIGGVLAGLGFMLPGFVLMLTLAWAYFLVDFDRPWIAGAMLAIQAAVIGLILRAVQRIGQHVLTDRGLWALGIGAGVATLLGVSFWITLPAAGLIHALLALKRPMVAAAVGIIAVLLATSTGISEPQIVDGVAAVIDAVKPGDAPPWLVFLTGLKAGLLTFGGAYTAIPFIREDIAGRGWMSDGQFLDGLALSGMLPAPLIIFATFVGYVAGGFGGAFAMTAGVFLPAFGFSLIFYDRLEAVVDNRALRSLLDGVAAGVVGLIAATTLQLAAGMVDAERDIARLAILVGLVAVSAAVVWRWKSAFATPTVVLMAGIVGAVLLRT